MRKFARTTVFLFMLFLALAATAAAQDITLAWDPNSEPNVAGYKIYYKDGTASLPFDGVGATNGPSPVDIGDATSISLNLPDDGRVYYFAVTAYDDSGYESSYSNIVANAPLPALIAPAPGSDLVPTDPTLEWYYQGPDPDVTYTLYYGTDAQLQADAVALDDATTPSSPLAAAAGIFSFGLLGMGMAPKRTRYLMATLVFFTTLLLSACGGGGGGSDSGTLLPSDVPATPTPGTQVVSGLSTEFYTATDLQPATTYYWKVVAVDAEGNRAESLVGSFVTQ